MEHGAGADDYDKPLRIIIADDHAIFRTGLRLALEAAPGIVSVKEAAHFEALLLLANEDPPDVLILDLRMPGLTIPDGVRTARVRFRNAPILFLSASSDTQDMIGCLAAGASGYVTKASEITTLLEAIRLVRTGGVYVPADVVSGQVDGIGSTPDAQNVQAPRLTRRQAQVVSLALDGHANKEIAYRLEMSEGTVKTHLAAVMRMYDVNNRIQLLRQVEKLGYR